MAKTLASLATGIMLAALMTLTGAAHAATFVYVSNAEDGDIGMYTLRPDGSLPVVLARGVSDPKLRRELIGSMRRRLLPSSPAKSRKGKRHGG